MKLLGVDYGLKRIGLAYSEGSLAQPMGKLTVNSVADALEKVLRTARTYEAEKIIVGVPDPDSIGAREFGEKLAVVGGLEVEFIDETMTTMAAQDRLKSHPQKKRRELLDSAAATLILASYLDSLNRR